MEFIDLKLSLCMEFDLQQYKEDSKYYVASEDLWNWLGVKTPHSKWIERRIEKYKFEVNKDYKIFYYKVKKEYDFNKNTSDKIVQGENVENARIIDCENLKKLSDFTSESQAMGGGYKRVYFILPDMCKQLAIVEDADKGRLVREYYLDLENYIIKTNQIEQFRKEEAHETYEFYNLIGHKGKCIELSKFLYKITSYKFNLDFLHNKEQIVTLSKYKINKDIYPFYLEMKKKAETFVETFMVVDSEHFIVNVKSLLTKMYIDDINKFNEYCNTHKESNLRFTVDIKEYKGCGIGIKNIYIPKNSNK